IGTGYVGSTGKGLVDTAAKKATPVGLLYGRIQSGKTRAMILSGAMALDNRFRVVVILTSDINRLVDQTHQDFIDGLPTVQIYSKSDIKGNSLDTEAAHIARSLEEESYGVVVVGSKGATVLKQLTEFLTKIGAEKYPTLIFDDEGDQATLDTNVSKRSTKDPSLQASTIHSLVHSKENDSLRQAMPYAAFVSVTGTPQGIFLQNAESSSKLSFVHLLEAGEKYVGGKVFFGEPTPTSISYIRTIDEDENIKLLEPETEVPDGLQDAICFFVVSATSAGITRGRWDDFKMLCHPSVKQSDHDSVMRLIDKYVGQIIVALRDTTSTEAAPILKKMEAAYSDLSKTCTGLPSLDDILKQAKTSILQRKLFVVNAKSTNDDMRYSKQYNFIVGGNTVGRGLAIKNLLVTYYTRMPKSTRADTMYQHARMFGYRGDTLPYTRVFLPPQLYDRFHQIYLSDEEARDYIQKNGFDDRGALLLRTAQPGFGLKPTRPNILDANRVKVIYPGHAIYPNYPKYKKGEVEPINTKVDQLIGKIAPNLVSNGSQEISVTDAEKIAKAIKTNATNTWADKQVANYLKSFAHQLKKDKVLLRYRTSKRQPGGSEGYLSQGILNVEELKAGRENAIPTIILAKIAGKGWDGVDFYYPTIISPDTLSPFIFNKN
ncbi:MAG TPA: Z1 domain-containing protein, partial [Candidatus Dormibacteraeota bacterium]|nr:Z1 domain-containing protein [Candidatus Dormibacteraeota bacterium]